MEINRKADIPARGPQTVGPDPEGPKTLKVAVPWNCWRGRRPVLPAVATPTRIKSAVNSMMATKDSYDGGEIEVDLPEV